MDVERRCRPHEKPHPDLLGAAADRLSRAGRLVVIGDTTWDAIAAANGRPAVIGLLSGGFGADELREAGCRAVYADAAELAESLEAALATATAPSPA